MLPAPEFANVLKHRSLGYNPLCAILLAPLFTRVGEEDIIPRIGYLNDRTARNIHFYCAGYGGYWNYNTVPDMEEIGDVHYENNIVIPWAFSQSRFASFVDAMERKRPINRIYSKKERHGMVVSEEGLPWESKDERRD